MQRDALNPPETPRQACKRYQVDLEASNFFVSYKRLQKEAAEPKSKSDEGDKKSAHSLALEARLAPELPAAPGVSMSFSSVLSLQPWIAVG